MKSATEHVFRMIVFNILVAAFALTVASFFMGCIVKGWQIKQCIKFCLERGGIDKIQDSQGCYCNNGESFSLNSPEIFVSKSVLPESESE